MAMPVHGRRRRTLEVVDRVVELGIVVAPLFLALTLAPASILAQVACTDTSTAAIQHVPVPGNPFQAIASSDGCSIFVSLFHDARLPWAGPAGIAVLRRSDGTTRLSRTVALTDTPRGMVLTHDGQLLIVAADSAIMFLDAARLVAGDSAPLLGKIKEGGAPYRILVNVTRDDRWLFSSDERTRSITVIDLAAARRDGFGASSIVGRIPVGTAPIALEFSPDERYLYSTSEIGLPDYAWPAPCKAEGTRPDPNAPANPLGAVHVIDVQRAVREPAHAVLSTTRAACSPVRLVLSPAGDIAYVSARNSNAVLVFDTARLLNDSAHALIDSIPVGAAPVGIALVDGGRHLVVANSNRFNGDTTGTQQLTVLDVSDVRRRSVRMIGHVPAGVFPRELHATPDGKQLLVTNFTSRTVDLVRLPATHQ